MVLLHFLKHVWSNLTLYFKFDTTVSGLVLLVNMDVSLVNVTRVTFLIVCTSDIDIMYTFGCPVVRLIFLDVVQNLNFALLL